MAVMNEFKQLMSKLKRESRIKECFCVSDQCSSIIKTHSIQNNRILKQIAEDGVVIQLQLVDNDAETSIDIEKIGRKVATISTNFCGFHDTKLFLPIESKDYRKNDKEQEFLFAYRAFAREYHAKLEVRNFHENARKMAKGEYKHFFDLALQGTNVALQQLEKEKARLNRSLENSDFGILRTYVIEFHGSYQIAASSLIAIKYDLYGNEINDIFNHQQDLKFTFLSVFPQGKKTFVLLSFYSKDRKALSFINKQIMKRSINEQKVIISNLILYHAENFVFSPRVWRSISQEKQDTIRQVFLRTANSFENRLSNLVDINLFV
jgi:hypothetical protein